MMTRLPVREEEGYAARCMAGQVNNLHWEAEGNHVPVLKLHVDPGGRAAHPLDHLGGDASHQVVLYRRRRLLHAGENAGLQPGGP